MKCSIIFWELTLALKTNGDGCPGVLPLWEPHTGMPMLLFTLIYSKLGGGRAHKKVLCDHWELGKTQNVCEEKFLEGATPATNPSAGLMRQLESRRHQKGRTAAEPSPVIIYLWLLCAPLIAIPHLPLCLS